MRRKKSKDLIMSEDHKTGLVRFELTTYALGVRCASL